MSLKPLQRKLLTQPLTIPYVTVLFNELILRATCFPILASTLTGGAVTEEERLREHPYERQIKKETTEIFLGPG
ncbi:hypothetical protein TNCV_92611 [Trichonephila clavipes]|nr:hypothetical protein TNCV_92611 [Trichonephila clavipes]